jgi:hypothetical protein
MTSDVRQTLYQRTLELLKPVLERVVSDPSFRERLESAPLAVLDELGVQLDSQTRTELEGKRFSEFWAERRRSVEGPVQVRDLPPEPKELADQQLAGVVGGLVLGTGPIANFAPPYVPVGPAPSTTLDTNLIDPTRLGGFKLGS